MIPSQPSWVVVNDTRHGYGDKWSRWARKLLDCKYLQSVWSEIGNFLKHIKAIKIDRLRALRADRCEDRHWTSPTCPLHDFHEAWLIVRPCQFCLRGAACHRVRCQGCHREESVTLRFVLDDGLYFVSYEKRAAGGDDKHTPTHLSNTHTHTHTLVTHTHTCLCVCIRLFLRFCCCLVTVCLHVCVCVLCCDIHIV